MGGGGGGGTGSVVLAGADALGAMVKLGVGAGAVTEAVAVEVGVGSTTMLPGSEGSPHAASDEKTTSAGQIGRGALLRAIVDMPDLSADSSGRSERRAAAPL
jgi:hypothetical protein